MTKKNFPRKLVRRLCQFFITISLIIVTLLLPLTVIPCLFYKLFVRLCVRLFGPKGVTNYVATGNAYFALERATQKPKTNIVGFIVLDREMDIDKVREMFEERVILKKTKTGKLVYPELRQVIYKFMGYFFWKYEDNFNLSDHIRTYDYDDEECRISKDCCTEQDLQRAMGGLISKPWKEGFSQWELLYIPNYQGEPSTSCGNGLSNELKEGTTKSSVLCFSLHHCMGDGYGWLNLLVLDLGQGDRMSVDVPSISRPKRSPLLNILAGVILPIKLFWDVATDVVESYNPVHAWNPRSKQSGQLYTSISRPFSVHLIKDLKNKFGVTYMSILSSVAAGGIRRVMEEAGQKVPKTIGVLNPFPLLGHPHSLEIHATAIHIPWPIAEKDPRKRLNEVFHSLRKKVWMTSPKAFVWAAKLTSVFPGFMCKPIITGRLGSVTAGNFPGPLNPPSLLGCKPIDIMVGCGLGPGPTGAFLSTVSLSGRQRFVVNIDRTIFPSQEIFQKLGQYIEEELELLKNLPADPSPEAIV